MLGTGLENGRKPDGSSHHTGGLFHHLASEKSSYDPDSQSGYFAVDQFEQPLDAGRVFRNGKQPETREYYWICAGPADSGFCLFGKLVSENPEMKQDFKNLL